jgi:hypothetical protein
MNITQMWIVRARTRRGMIERAVDLIIEDCVGMLMWFSLARARGRVARTECSLHPDARREARPAWIHVDVDVDRPGGDDSRGLYRFAPVFLLLIVRELSESRDSLRQLPVSRV